jgi:uncharacterized protein (TIGR02271 family)
MTSALDAQQLIGRTAVDADGDKVGKIGEVYLDDQTGQPAWVTVSTGLFGSKQSFAPLYGASQTGEELRLAVTKEQVKGAPNIDDDGHIGAGEEGALYEYYRDYLGGSGQRTGYADTGYADTGRTGEVGGPGRDTSGPNTDDAMTRSEERINVGTQHVETGRARLRKYVVTENVTQTVPVSHEEVRVEREPITDANIGAATEGPAISEEEHEVTLHAERPVVEKEAVPVERVRLDTETVTDQQTISDDVRKEQIDVEGDDTGRRTTR